MTEYPFAYEEGRLDFKGLKVEREAKRRFERLYNKEVGNIKVNTKYQQQRLEAYFGEVYEAIEKAPTAKLERILRKGYFYRTLTRNLNLPDILNKL